MAGERHRGTRSAPTGRSTARSRRERATAVVLVPTAALVVLMLAALAVDAAVLRAQQGRIRSIAESAADDAAGMIDARRVQLDGGIVVDEAEAERTARAHLLHDGVPGVLRSVDVRTTPDRVEVMVRVEVRRLLMGAVPGVGRITVVPVRALARVDPPSGSRP